MTTDREELLDIIENARTHVRWQRRIVGEATQIVKRANECLTYETLQLEKMEENLRRLAGPDA